MSYPYEKKKIDPWMVFGISSIIAVSAYYTFFREDGENKIENGNVPQSQETMTFVGSEHFPSRVHPVKYCYFDTDNDLSTAEVVKEVFLSDGKVGEKATIAAYNLKRGDVVKKSDWTQIVRRAQQEKIRE